MTDIALVIFDLAGTTVKDEGQVPRAFTAALAQHGIAATPEAIDAVRGSSKREAVRRFIPPGPAQLHLADEVYLSFRAHLAEAYASGGVRPIDGAEAAFQWLRRCGVRVALNTGFDRDTTNLLITALGWDGGCVDAIVCGDDVPRGRPAPYLIFRAMEATGAADVHAVANVGDTVVDLQAAYHAGVRWNIAVLTGAHRREALEAEPHTHVIESVADVKGVLAMASLKSEA